MACAGKEPSGKEHTHMYVCVRVYIPSVTLGEAAALATQAMGAQAQMHMEHR